MVEFDALLAAIEGKGPILETLNDKILSQMMQMELRRRRFRPMSIPWKYISNCTAYERSEINILSVSQKR